MGPGDRSPEEQAEEIIQSSDENVDDLARGTEVFDETDSAAAAEEPAEAEAEDLGEDDNEF